ncbi:MAG: tetratricopeptide repeat protein [Patescibacteria group bacterium]|nr:tetratricopeptide repeat protein [Patescibacteria group bacterium]
MEALSQSTPTVQRGGNASSFVLAALAFLLPLFFIPSAAYPFQFSKTALALVATVLIFILFVARTLRSRTFSGQRSLLSLAIVTLPVTYLVSSIFSSVPSLSFMGYQLDQDTFGFMLLAAALALVTTVALNSEGKILSVLVGLLFGGWLVILFQLIQIFFGTPLSFGIFTQPAYNLVGTWNDFGLFVSLIATLSLLSLETLSLTTARKAVLGVTLVVALALLSFVGFSLAWYLLGVVAFATLIFSYMRWSGMEGDGARRGTRGVASLLAFIVVVFFAFFGSGASTAFQNHFNLAVLDVSPSFQGTLTVLESAYHQNPFFGSGPNTFGNAWYMARPADTLQTLFWSTDFTNGVGYIPTAFTTGGIVVALGWLFLLVVFSYTAVRALLSASFADEHSYFLLLASTIGSAFLLIAHIFYNPSAVMTLFLFLFLGLFVVSLRPTRFVKNFSFSFRESPRLGFLTVLVVAVVLVLSLASLYKVGQAYVASVDAGHAAVLANANNVSGALTYAEQAAALFPRDVYYRAITTLELSQMNTLVSSGKNDSATQQSFQTDLSTAVTAATAAISLNPSYDNYMNRASVYEAAASLGIQGASDNAITALEAARKANPHSPEVDYQEALLKNLAKDYAGAKTAANASLAQKADYTPAILLLSQIALNQGNLADAITSLKSAIVLTPNDSSLVYQLGLLELQNKDYQNAADTFNQALAITPSYANAKFFLGAADIYLGQKDAALALFNDLKTANPGNTTLDAVISATEAGKNPFATSTSPLPPASTPASTPATTPAAGQ